jgi:hypothetical protein
MTENICLMLTESNTTNAYVRALKLAATAVDLRQHTVLYLAGCWADYAQAGYLEKEEGNFRMFFPKGESIMDVFRHFQQDGGQIWVSAFNAANWNLNKHPLAAGATLVDDRTLLTFLTQGTVVLNF